MKNKYLLLFSFFGLIICIAIACKKDTPAPTPPPDYSFSEEFDTVANSIKRGWVLANNSKPIGTAGWKQGVFYYENKKGTGDGFAALNASYSGTDFIMTSTDCGHGIANCSNWLISPPVMMKDGDIISFYTRTYENPALAGDRMEVRINTSDNSSDVGTDSSSIGNFTQVLLDINPTYKVSGSDSYPGVWTQYNLLVSGMPKAQEGRIAFRYYVPNGGPNGVNGIGIGIDRFSFTSK